MRPVDTSLVSLSYADTCHCILPYSDPCTLTLQMKEGTALDLGGLVVSSLSSVSTWPGGHLVPHYWCYHYISVSNPITSYYFMTLFSYAISDWVSILRTCTNVPAIGVQLWSIEDKITLQYTLYYLYECWNVIQLLVTKPLSLTPVPSSASSFPSARGCSSKPSCSVVTGEPVVPAWHIVWMDLSSTTMIDTPTWFEHSEKAIQFSVCKWDMNNLTCHHFRHTHIRLVPAGYDL